MLNVECRKNVAKNEEFKNNAKIRMRLDSWDNK